MTDITTRFATIGIDLGDKQSHYACVDETGTIVEEGTVGMTMSAFRKALELFEPTRVVIEAGAQSRWVEGLLSELGHEVIVANPRRVQLIAASQKKNDRHDARLLAKLGLADPELLCPLKHRGAEPQETLIAIRARDQLVRGRTALSNCLRGIAKTLAIRLPRVSSDQYLARCRAALPAALLPHLEELLKAIDHLTQGIEAYDEHLEQLAAQKHPEVQRLRSVPGVGTLTAVAFVATLGEANRFAKSRDVGAYLGLRPGQRQSGSSNPQLGISKAGDRHLRRLLVQAAHCVLRTYAPDSALKQWAQKLCERGGRNARKRAIVAVARKLAVLLHKLWVSGEFYRPFPGRP
jgi:transposase